MFSYIERPIYVSIGKIYHAKILTVSKIMLEFWLRSFYVWLHKRSIIFTDVKKKNYL